MYASSLIGLKQNVNNSGIVLQFVMCDLSVVWMKFQFPSSTDVTNYLFLYVINCYIVVCTITIFHLTMCLTVIKPISPQIQHLHLLQYLVKSDQVTLTYFLLVGSC